MTIQAKSGDVLDYDADILVCSANVFLNLSGGVGGEILRRYGDAMQRAMHQYLRDRKLNYVQPTEVVETEGFGTHFQRVLHVVAVDAWYRSSCEVVHKGLSKAFTRASELSASTVAVVAIGTGYGRLSFADFGKGLRGAASAGYPGIDAITVVVRYETEAEEIRLALDEPLVP